MLGRYTTGPYAGDILPYGYLQVKVQTKLSANSCFPLCFVNDITLEGIINHVAEHPIPGAENRSELFVSNSRFIATIAPVFNVDQARQFIQRIRGEFPDASHHVPAYIIGYGSSVTTHCSDDGEPSGTAGRPALAVLTGSGLGDAAVVVTRYFGGTKLGTGGLVRAYSDAVREVLKDLPLAHKVATITFMINFPYSYFERLRKLIDTASGTILDQDFSGDVTVTARVASDQYLRLQAAVQDATNGGTVPVLISEEETIFPYRVN